MIILDANGLIYCLINNVPIPEEPLLVTDELQDEFETALIVNGHKPLNIKHIEELPEYSEAYYLKQYAHYLNTLSGVNVASMRSLADASVLALVACLVNQFGNSQQLTFDLGIQTNEEILVITNDETLVKRLQLDFGEHIRILHPSEI